MNKHCVPVWCMAVVLCVTAAGADVTLDSLLDELTDLGRLAELPSPAYVTRQFSSYDRRSKTPADAEDWFANGDRGQFLRTEQREGRAECVMMDAAGPGAIVRIWSANPDGRLWFFLDDNPEPAFKVDMKELLGGKTPGLPEPIAGERGQGWNLYFPIPYAKRCKVTCEKASFYYHINYRTYAAGTEVTSFTKADLERLADKVKQVAERLAAPAKAAVPAGDMTSREWKLAIAPNEAATLAEIEGPGAIVEIRATLSAPDLVAAAAGLVLSMSFDGETTVECPLGDFFGTAPGLDFLDTLPTGITKTDRPEMWCHWRMPFARSARIVVRNLASQKVELAGRAAVMSYTWSEQSLLFHAKWRIQRDLPARPFTDWTHLECTGAGRFVGSQLHVVNPVREWWGEGDEKIYVDAEKFPSWFGTGTEDYYGYAWGSDAKFTHAYHAQTRCDGPGTYGHTSVCRFHVLDDIPFTSQFKFDMETWHWNVKARMTRSVVSYWYARPGATDFFKPITPADVVPVQVAAYVPHREPGAIEGEGTKVLDGRGRAVVQDLGPQWSNEKQRWWTGAAPGDKLVLSFNSPEEGVRRVVVRLTRANDYAQVQLYVNDRKAGGVVDLYSEGVEPTDEIDLGACELVKGENRLTVEILGAHPKAKPEFMFGLDYLKIR